MIVMYYISFVISCLRDKLTSNQPLYPSDMNKIWKFVWYKSNSKSRRF